MNMYFTGGTEEYLKKVIENHQNESFVLMHNEDVFLLAHETEGNTVFKEPKKYEVVDSSGTIAVPSGFAVCNHIPVTDEGATII